MPSSVAVTSTSAPDGINPAMPAVRAMSGPVAALNVKTGPREAFREL